MARLTRPSSGERLHYVRSRLRKAACMNDNNTADDDSDDELPPPHPSLSLSPSPEQEQNPSSWSLAHQAQEDINEQSQCAFFTQLPPEIRRMVYCQIWRASSDTMKMHIHAASEGSELTHTPCKCSTPESSLDEGDPMRIVSWPSWRGQNQPPRWFWHAWGLRLRWGAHWRCQADAMLAWKTSKDGTCIDERFLRQASFLDVFLTCKRMYTEAIESFFESTTLLFTASEDAYRFFVQQPHPYQSKIHAVDFNFTHFKDHLFLQAIASKHPRLAGQSKVPVAQGLWTPLMLCVREKLPELQWLRIHLSTSTPTADVENIFDVLREWQQQGHGTLEEGNDGLVYVEQGRLPAALVTEVEQDP